MGEFDEIAEDYNDDFTFSAIGQIQRQQVWSYVDRHFNLEGKDVLELNCGTGIDANEFEKRGAHVIATDGSKKMVELTQKRNQGKVEALHCTLQNIGNLPPKKYDLIFSNFGGINCLAPADMKRFFAQLGATLKSDGRLILVIMPKECLWDQWYLRLKGIKNYKRRNTSKAVKVPVGKRMVNTWYYSPIDIERFAQADFKNVGLKPIGLYVPPSYMNPFFAKRKVLLSAFSMFDSIAAGVPFLAKYADHFLIELKAKNE